MSNNLHGDTKSARVELIMVMLLLVLFGVAIYTLIVSGSNAQEKILADKKAIENVRIAMSYLDVKVRQNDENGKISVEPNPINALPSIRIQDEGYDTWIYWYQDAAWERGKLLECLVLENTAASIDTSFEIIDVDSFEPVYDKTLGTITNTVTYRNESSPDSDPIKKRTAVLHLKTK